MADKFNPILPSGKKLPFAIAPGLLGSKKRHLTGNANASEYAAIPVKSQHGKRVEIAKAAHKRIGEIIQLRHDWIHNCGRPKTAIITLTSRMCHDRVEDIAIYAKAFDDLVEGNRVV